MCDLMHFVISSINFEITSANLSRLLMSEVVLRFDMCLVIVIDDGRTFKIIYTNVQRLRKHTLGYLKRQRQEKQMIRVSKFSKKRQSILMIESPMTS